MKSSAPLAIAPLAPRVKDLDHEDHSVCCGTAVFDLAVDSVCSFGAGFVLAVDDFFVAGRESPRLSPLAHSVCFSCGADAREMVARAVARRLCPPSERVDRVLVTWPAGLR